MIAVAAMAQIGDAHARICGSADGMFGRIREAVASSAVPAVKAAMLEPVYSGLAARLTIALFSDNDATLMDMFTGEPLHLFPAACI